VDVDVFGDREREPQGTVVVIPSPPVGDNRDDEGDAVEHAQVDEEANAGSPMEIALLFGSAVGSAIIISPISIVVGAVMAQLAASFSVACCTSNIPSKRSASTL
jgi:hypothetical protein